MKIRETITIVVYPLRTNLPVENEHVLIAEFFETRHDRYYLARLPETDNQIRRRLRYYKNILN